MSDWTVDDVMSTAVVAVDAATTCRDVVNLLTRHRFGAVPVVDASHRVTGVVSEADLVRRIEYAGDGQPRLPEPRRRRGERAEATSGTVADLMSTPPVVVAGGTAIAAAARLMDAADVKRLPVTDDVGRLIGIVSRGDLLKVHLRPDGDILADVVGGVLRPFLAEDAAAVTATVVDGVVALNGRVERASTVDLLARLTRRVAGVVEVAPKLEFAYDDRAAVTPGGFSGIA